MRRFRCYRPNPPQGYRESGAAKLMTFEEWLADFASRHGGCDRTEDEHLEEAWHAGWDAGVDYIARGGSFK